MKIFRLAHLFLGLNSKFDQKIHVFVRENSLQKSLSCGFELMIQTGYDYYYFFPLTQTTAHKPSQNSNES